MIYEFDDLTFQILNIDLFHHKKGYIEAKARPFAALSFRISGDAAFKISGNEFKCDTWDLLFIPEGVAYAAEYSGGDSIVIHMNKCNYKIYENITVANKDLLYNLFTKLLENWQKNHQVNAAKSTIYKILQYTADANQSHLTDTDIWRCISFINDNFSDSNISISDICNAGNMSESTMRRKFSAIYKTSVKKYITKLRMDKAVSLLVSGDFSVREISNMCGFEDEKYFSRVFKNYFKMPPRMFKL